jgi:hypothetical protein
MSPVLTTQDGLPIKIDTQGTQHAAHFGIAHVDTEDERVTQSLDQYVGG